MKDTAFEKEFQSKKERFEKYFSSFTDNIKDVPEPLISSMKYSLSGTGKRIRPLLLLSAADAFKEEESESRYKMACAIECVHTYSLIHDDLPCMDNSDLRRGKPTNHKIFGECVATLAGDALLNLVYETIFDAVMSCPESQRSRYIQAGKIIADLSGSRGLIAGQIVDTVVTTDKHLAAHLNYVYQHKTADLISASLMAGAIIGGAAEQEIKKIKEIGDNIGYIFQIVDDILDADSASDENKNTFISLYGSAKAKAAITDRTAIALELLSSTGGNVSFLRSFVRNLSARKI